MRGAAARSQRAKTVFERPTADGPEHTTSIGKREGLGGKQNADGVLYMPDWKIALQPGLT